MLSSPGGSFLPDVLGTVHQPEKTTLRPFDLLSHSNLLVKPSAGMDRIFSPQAV